MQLALYAAVGVAHKGQIAIATLECHTELRVRYLVEEQSGL